MDKGNFNAGEKTTQIWIYYVDKQHAILARYPTDYLELVSAGDKFISPQQSFLCFRNALLHEKGLKAPTAYKTGTTIVGIVYKVTEKNELCL